jgi:8-oxo-dGTP diphosphatase
MRKVQVVAAVIQRGSKFLLGKRSLSSKKSAPGCWCPISGKIELGESEAEAVVRECFEEVGLTVKAIRKITEFEIEQGRADLHWWLVEVINGQEFLKNDEHTEIRWFSVEEMKQTTGFFQEDIEVYSKISIE